MKYFLLLMFSTTQYYHPACAQYRKSIEVKAGTDAAQAFSSNGFYRFPQFSKGALFSRVESGNSSRLFNYDLLRDKIVFINQGDTMEMTNPKLFDSVIIDQDILFYRQEYGFLEQVAVSSPVKLVKKTTIKIKPLSVGAYDGTTTTSAINKLTTYTTGFNVYNFSINEDVVIKESIDWFWIGENGEIKKATKKNLFDMLPPAKQQMADSFLSKNKINFSKEEDLGGLLRSL